MSPRTDKDGLLHADWPAPDNIMAFVTTRHSGDRSSAPDGFNLAFHCGNDTAAVERNRERLQQLVGPDRPIQWLQQVHGTNLVIPSRPGRSGVPEGDAVLLGTSGAAAVMTADCLPVFFSSMDGAMAGVAHAGWRGLAGGVLASMVRAMDCAPRRILVWLGPAIGPCHFEVGNEVRDAFLATGDQALAQHYEAGFRSGERPGKWMADLYTLARAQLLALGVDQVHGGHFCTFCDRDHFHSYRRSPRSGRMANVICINRS